MKLKLIFASVISLALLGCGGGGGGGGSSTTPTTSGTAEGLWSGTSSNGYGVAVLILENAETWGIYYSGSTIWGALYGTSTGSGTTFNATGTDFYFATRTSSAGSLTGTVIAGQTINATSSNTGTSVSLSYNNTYNTPANLANAAGSYVGWGVTKSTLAQTVRFTVTSSGAISASEPGCSVSGTLSTRASGKNVYNVSTTFTGNQCALGNGVTTTGVATLDSTSGVNRLFVMTLNSGKTDGYIINATSSGTPGVAATVPAQTAVSNWLRDANSQFFNVSTSNGCLGTLRSTKTNGTSASGTFEGVVRNYSTTTTTINYSNCTPSSFTGVERTYTDSSYIPLGFLRTSGSPLNDAFYGVYSSTPAIPANLTAGTTGTIGTINLYTNSTKSTSAGRSVVTYTSSAETSTSLLLNLTYTVYDASNQLTYTEVNTFRITTGGVATLLAGEATYADGFVLTFR
jgi:hypothetical protein